MIVLGIDPGYRNLGLSVVKVSDDGKEFEILHSDSVSVGKATAPLLFAKFLWPKLSRLSEEYGPIEAIGTETPPFIMGQIQTTAFLWSVSSIIAAWACDRGIPMRNTSPIGLKRATAKLLEIPFNRKGMASKKDVRRAVERVVGKGTSGKTSHENDATLAVIALFGSVVPE